MTELARAERHLREALLELRRHVTVHAFVHVTGGGIAGQPRAGAARALPRDRAARRWEEPRIFAEIQQAGDVCDEEMEQVFNLGLGHARRAAAVTRPTGRSTRFGARGHEAWLVA